MDRRFTEAVRLYRDHATLFAQPTLSGLDLRAHAFDQLATCHDALGEVDAALRACEELATTGAVARAMYRAGQIAEWAGRAGDARAAYGRAADAQADAGDHDDTRPRPASGRPAGAAGGARSAALRARAAAGCRADRRKAPWPAGQSFRAGGFGLYIAEQAAALNPLTLLAFAARDCGYGPAGFYDDFASHQGSDAFAIDFTRYRRFVYYDNVSGAPRCWRSRPAS